MLSVVLQYTFKHIKYFIKEGDYLKMANSNDMSVAVGNIQAFEDASTRLCDYQEQMNKTYLNIIDSIKMLMQHGVEKECDTLSEYVKEFKEKFPDGANTYAIQLLGNAMGKYDEFYAAFSTGKGQFNHATIKGLINAARIYKELEKDMFYDRGVKFEYATDKSFVSVSKMDLY